ncbi:MAG: CapA family protein [Patescibacteria group bacterium]
MKLKRILDGVAIGVFVLAVFGLGWNVAGTSNDFREISKNFEAAVSQSQVSTDIIKDLDFSKVYKKDLKLVFVGDIMLSRGVANQIKENDDFNYPFLNIADYLNSFDLAIGNLEGPISNKGTNQGSIYSFRADPKVVEGLKYAGFDVVSLANNHMLDWGREALVQTRDLLEADGIKVTGAGKDYIEANEPPVFGVEGQKLAFLSYTDLYPKSLSATEALAGVSDFNIEKIKAEIGELKKEGNLVVILMHWGEEYHAKSDTTQQKIARVFIDAGADLIVGTHPHVAQEIEEYLGKYIVYSLGNFVFDQNFSAETMKGMAVEVDIRDGSVTKVLSREVEISPTFQPEISK